MTPRPCALLLLSLLATGCIETHLYSGLPPGDPPPGYEHRWHVSYLFGLTEGSGPYDLGKLCPGGWSEITVAPDFFTSVTGMITLYLYTPNRVTIICARSVELDTPPGVDPATPPPGSLGPPSTAATHSR